MTNAVPQLEGVEMSGSDAARYLLSFAAKSALGDQLALPPAFRQQLDGLINGIDDPALAGIFKRDIATAKDLDEYLAFLGKAMESGENPDLARLKDAIDQFLDDNLTVLAGVFNIRTLLVDEAFHLTGAQTKELAMRHFGMIKDKVAICKLMTERGRDIVLVLLLLAIQVCAIGMLGSGVGAYIYGNRYDYPLWLFILTTAVASSITVLPLSLLRYEFNEKTQKYVESQIGISEFNEFVEKFNELLADPNLNLTDKKRVVSIVQARQQLGMLRTQIGCSTDPDSDDSYDDSQRAISNLNARLGALIEVNELPSLNDGDDDYNDCQRDDRRKLLAARRRVTA
jgi:hypothetical protein